MLEDKTIVVENIGPTWLYNVQHGFRMRVRFSITNEMAREYLKDHGMLGSTKTYTYAKRQLYRQYREVAARFLGDRKVGWNARSFKENDDDILIYCHELEWMVLAKLAGYTSLMNAITCVEKLDA